MHHFQEVMFLLIEIVNWLREVSYTSIFPKSDIENANEALEHALAVVFSYNV
jgi:hypothetical protein